VSVVPPPVSGARQDGGGHRAAQDIPPGRAPPNVTNVAASAASGAASACRRQIVRGRSALVALARLARLLRAHPVPAWAAGADFRLAMSPNLPRLRSARKARCCENAPSHPPTICVRAFVNEDAPLDLRPRRRGACPAAHTDAAGVAHVDLPACSALALPADRHTWPSRWF